MHTRTDVGMCQDKACVAAHPALANERSIWHFVWLLFWFCFGFVLLCVRLLSQSQSHSRCVCIVVVAADIFIVAFEYPELLISHQVRSSFGICMAATFALALASFGTHACRLPSLFHRCGRCVMLIWSLIRN